MDLSTIKNQLFPAVVGDVMDRMGLRHQFLPPWVQPLKPDMVVLGYAMPVMEADCHGMDLHSEGRSIPFGKMLEALDNLGESEVYVCAGGSGDYAQWGELMSTRASQVGAAGAVVNGYSRDTLGILNLGFATFSRGRYAQDQSTRGRVIDYRCPVEFPNACVVYPGDLVFGDIDGVVIVPEKMIDEVVEGALDKVSSESGFKAAVENGMTTMEAFAKFGVM